MANLVLVCVAILLVGLMTGGGWLLAVGPVKEREAELLAEAGFVQLAAGYRAYMIANPRSAPRALSQFVPDFVRLPTPPQGMAWSYGLERGRRWVCLSGQPQGDVFAGVRRAAARIPGLVEYSTLGCNDPGALSEPALWPDQPPAQQLNVSYQLAGAGGTF